MTSGHFHILPIGDISVDREGRQRRELDPKEIEILADSIRRLGLIHPIVVTRERALVAGERRYAACTALGWTNIPVQYTDELDTAQLRAIELEENIKRVDIAWRDQVMAVREYHALRNATEENWTQGETAKAIGLSPQHTGEMLQIAEELISGNEMVAAAPLLSTARGIVRRALERKDQQAIDAFRSAHLKSGPVDAPLESILITDFTEWVLGQSPIKFNFIHCDFPYGIEADTFNQGSAPAFGGYTDTRETWERLMFALEIAVRDHLALSAHLMFWFAMRKGTERLYESTVRRLEAMGWDINPLPLIWMKSDGVGILPDPERGPRQIYETCLLGSRGDRKIVRAVSNAYHSPTVRERHMSEKPEPMLRYFFGMLVDQNTIMLDPTSGSGSALRAAESLGAKHVLGLEINPEFAQIAKEALNRARILHKASEGAS